MARSSGELWFEMGVRDKVQEALKKDIELSEKLEGRFGALVKKYSALDGGGHRAMGKKLRKEMDDLVKSSDKYLGVLQKIKIQREKLLSTRSKALSMGIDTKELDSAIAKLNAWSANYSKIAKKYGTDSAMLATKTGQQFRFRMQWIDDVVRSYGKLISVEEKEGVTAARAVQQANQGLSASYDKVTQSAQKNMGTLAMLRQQAGYYFSLFGAKTLLQNVITIGGQFEYQHVALQNIIGDAEKATVLFSQLKDLAIESPRTFMDLVTSAKQLSAYQIPVNELYDTTKRLSDLSVGLGVDMSRLILAYGQVRSAAVLRGQELRQFTEAGIPIVQALADKFTQMNGKLTTTADVFKLISQRAVPFEMVKEVLWDMTNEGGRFYNMQEEMADTLYGKWQKLADIWQITLGDMANSSFLGIKPFHALVETLVFAARSLQTLMPVFTSLLLSKGIRFFTHSSANIFGLTGVEANITKAQQLQAIELRRKFVNGEITKKIYQQRAALNANRDNYYMILAAEGKINDFQIRSLIEQKKITAEKVRQAQVDGMITKEEAMQLRLLMQKNAQGKLGTMGSAAKGVWNSVLGFMGGPTGVAITGIGVATAIYQSVQQQNEEAEARLKERVSAAQELWKKAHDVEKSLSSGNINEEEIVRMSDWLKENSASWDMVSESMKNNDGTAKSLEERYQILKKAIEDVESTAEKMANGDNIFIAADKHTGRGIFGDSIGKNLHDAQEGYENIGKVIDAIIGRDLIPLTKAMDELLKNSPKLQDIFAERGADTLAKQLKIVLSMKDEYAKLYEISKKYHISASIGGLTVALTEYRNELKKAEEQIPAFATYVENELRGAYAQTGIDFKNLTSEQKEYILKLYKEWLDENKITSDAVLRELDEKFLNKRYNIRLVLTTETGNVNMSGFAKYVWEKRNGNIAGDKGKVVIGGKEYSKQQVSQTFTDDTWLDKTNQQMDNIEESIKRYEKLGDKASAAAKRTELSGLQAMLDDIAPGLRSKKDKGGRGKGGGGGSQTDTVAKALAERVRVLKEAYSEYKKWLSVMSKDEALKKVQESGLFAPLFGGDSPVNLDDYANELRKIQSQLDMSKPEQRKVGETITSILLGMDYDSAKEEAQRAVLLMTTAMDEIAKQWDLYKNLYEKTGNREFAMNAFTKGILWDDKTRALAERLGAEYGRGDISYSMSASEAKDFFGESGKAYYDQWKKIVELIQGNYTKSLEDVASAMSSLMDEEEKIRKIEQEIADLRKQGATDSDARIIQKQKEIVALEQQAFEKSGDYLKFFNSILSLTIPEAEAIGQKIRENLDKNMRKGTISAKEYVRQVKLINEQMEKLRSKQGDMSALLTGGLQGLFQNKYNRSEGDFNQSVIDMQKATEDYQKAQMAGDVAGMESAKAAQASAASMQEGAAAAMEGASGAMSTVAVIDKIVHGINDTVQGIKGTFDEVKEMFDALGSDTESNGWENWNTFFDGFSKASQNATDAWDSLKNGNVGGVVKGVVGSFTSWITAFAQGHDRKLEKSIKRSIQRVKELANEYTNLQNKIERALGGIYTAGGYDDMFANYTKQLKELRGQLRDEEDKKKTDSGKVADYKQQIKEMEDSIAHFAEDMAKSLYDIDVKSWAQQLTDAVVDAWAKGEDAAQAWHDKVKDIVNDLTKNILTQKVVEMAMQPVLKYITDEMTAKSGKLDQANVIRIAQMLDEAGKSSVTTITSLLDYMKSMGYDLSDSASKEGNLSTAITSITEEAGDLLVSYVAAIRADVGVNREQLTQICAAVQSIPEMNIVAQSQLRQLEMIAANTGRNADSNDDILTIVRGFRDGLYSIKVK